MIARFALQITCPTCGDVFLRTAIHLPEPAREGNGASVTLNPSSECGCGAIVPEVVLKLTRTDGTFTLVP